MSSTELQWTFFSHYAHVLICLAENPRARLREVAERVGVTERTATRLIDRLEEAGIVRRIRQGRRNLYLIESREKLTHPIEARCSVEELLNSALEAGSGFQENTK